MKRYIYFVIILLSVNIAFAEGNNFVNRKDSIGMSFGISYSVFYSHYHYPMKQFYNLSFEDITLMSLTTHCYKNHFGLGIGTSIGEKTFSAPGSQAPTGQKKFTQRLGFNIKSEYYPFKKQKVFNPYLQYTFQYKFKKTEEDYYDAMILNKEAEFSENYFLENTIGLGCKITIFRSFYLNPAFAAGIYTIIKSYGNNKTSQSNLISNIFLSAGYDF